ncbi:MAG: hypothetical protein ACFFD4_06245, partial [Candidatus Odinarchaeota archaeon]
FEAGSAESRLRFIFSVRDQVVTKFALDQDGTEIGTWTLAESGGMMIWNVTSDIHGILEVSLLMFTTNSDKDQLYLTGEVDVDLQDLKSGNYTYTLSVWDGAGNPSTLDFTVTVTPSSTDTGVRTPGLTGIIAILALVAISAVLTGRKRPKKHCKEGRR